MNPVWSDKRIRDVVKAKMAHYKQQGATEFVAEAIAYSDVCDEMRDEYEALLLKLYEELAACMANTEKVRNPRINPGACAS